MVHSDDNGLVLPPVCVPWHVAVLTLFADKEPSVLAAAERIKKALGPKIRTFIDVSSKGLGYKLAEQEVIGTCLRIEIGPRDLAEGKVTVSSRIDGTKRKIDIPALKSVVRSELALYRKTLFERAQNRQNPVYAEDFVQFKQLLLQGGFVCAPWGGDASDEARLKSETTATARCLPHRPLRRVAKGTKCFYTGKKARGYVLFAVAY